MSRRFTPSGRRRAASLAAAIALAGGTALASEASAGTPPPDLYVAQTAACTDTGSGTEAAPFCTVSAAAARVEPGQTVRIGDGLYPETVTLTRSGTPDRPITFTGSGDTVATWPILAQGSAGVVVDGAHDIVLSRLGLGPDATFRLRDAQHVRLDTVDVFTSGSTTPGAQLPLVDVSGTSSDVTVVRANLTGSRAEGVRVGEGAGNVTVASSGIANSRGAAVLATNASGLKLAGNTMENGCGAAVRLIGTAADASVQNNMFERNLVGPVNRCGATAPEYGHLVVDGAAAPTVTADYNVVVGDPHNAGAAMYTWAGRAYPDDRTFRQGTGQGAHDVYAPNPAGIRVFGCDEKLTVDNGNESAPGQVSVDQAGRPRVDDPFVPNTGTGSGSTDRGACELQDTLRVPLTLDKYTVPMMSPVTATAKPEASWSPTIGYTFTFGDGSAPVVTDQAVVRHVYTRPGTYSVKVAATNGLGTTAYWYVDVTVTRARVPCTVLPDGGCAWGPTGQPVRR